MRKFFSLLLVLLLVFTSACTKQNGENNQGQAQDRENIANTVRNDSTDPDVPATVVAEGDLFTDRDTRTTYAESSCIKITLNGNSISASDASVKISGTTATITKDSSYIISGTLDNGQIIVDVPDTAKIQIVLKSASITSSSSAALFVKEADKVFLTLVGESKLSNGGTFTENDDGIDGALFSKQDLTLNGDGTLTVTSPEGHGIVCKDDLVMTGGTYHITAASHALDANDSIRIKNSTIIAKAGKDGLHAENNDDLSLGFIYIAESTLDLTTEGDGVSAGTYLQIPSSSITVLAGGGHENGTKASSDGFGAFPGGMGGGGRPGGRPRSNEPTSTETQAIDSASTSMKGLKAGGDISITGGAFIIDSADDALHANTSMFISGGTFEIATGDDALHAEDTLTIAGGTFRVTTSYEGLEALYIEVKDGDIHLVATDDGLNAAGGNDQSGSMGGRDGMFGGGFGGMGGGGFGGGFSANSNGSILISGGTLYIEASGDGIDANGTLEITGGHITVCGPTNGDTATLDYDKSALISGGTFLGTGASMMAQTFSENSQGVIAVQISTQSKNTMITVADSDGNVLLTHTPKLSYQVIILSSPDLISGQEYTLSVGTISETVTAK